jgi:hypothetical protein
MLKSQLVTNKNSFKLTFNIDTTVKDLSVLFYKIGVKMFAAASTCRRQKCAKTWFFWKRKLTSQKPKQILAIFFDIPKGEAFMHLQRKNQHCTDTIILSVLFCSEIKTRFTLCMRYTLCAGGPSLGAKSGLPDDFAQKIFPITPPGNGNVGMGPRGLKESGLKVD